MQVKKQALRFRLESMFAVSLPMNVNLTKNQKRTQMRNTRKENQSILTLKEVIGLRSTTGIFLLRTRNEALVQHIFYSLNYTINLSRRGYPGFRRAMVF